MSLLSRLLGSNDPADYTSREFASTRAIRKKAERDQRDRAASIVRHRKQGTREQRRAYDRGYR